MNDKHLKQVFEQIGKQAFPDNPEPWTAVHAQLTKKNSLVNNNRIISKQLIKPKTFGFVLGIGLILTILITALFITPDKQVLADMMMHLFKTAVATQFPTLTNEELATPTFAPTEIVTLVPVSVMAEMDTPKPIPTNDYSEEIKACGIDPTSYTCKIARAEKRAGFTPKQFPADPKGFIFYDVNTKPDEIYIWYLIIGGGGELYLDQGIGDTFPSFKSGVPDDAIEEVMVGKYPGEFVAGDWVEEAATKKVVWNGCCRSRLRWMGENRWFELEVAATMSPYSNRDAIIELANQLVDHPTPSTGPRPDYLINLNEAAQIAEFHILSPSILPEGYKFDHASYDKDLSHLRLNFMPPNGMGMTDVMIDETPIDKVYLDSGMNGEEIKGENVDINGNIGIYFSDSRYNHAVTWKSGSIKITLSVYSSEGFNSGFTKDQVLEIARSIK
jgi:hypothetical protein